MSGQICDSIRSELDRYQYHPDIINGVDKHNRGGVRAADASFMIHDSILRGADSNPSLLLADSKSNGLVFEGEYSGHTPSNPHIDLQLLITELAGEGNAGHLFRKKTSVPVFIRDKQSIVIYQSKGYHTGGTIALELLHRQFLSRGYKSLLCDTSNEADRRCSDPSGMSRLDAHPL